MQHKIEPKIVGILLNYRVYVIICFRPNIAFELVLELPQHSSFNRYIVGVIKSVTNIALYYLCNVYQEVISN